MSKLFGVDKPVNRPYTGMATTFDDAQAWINGAGNMSLGNGGFDDLAADATHQYAKGDVWINIPLASLVASSLTVASTFGRTSAGLYTLAMAVGAATGIIVIPLNFFFRKFAGASRAPALGPHGMKVTDMVIGYTIATVATTSLAVAFSTETDTNATARAASVTPFGAVTYENPLGTVVGTPPVATQATPYIVRVVPAAPVFVNTDNTDVYAEITSVQTATTVVTFTHIGFHCSLALY